MVTVAGVLIGLAVFLLVPPSHASRLSGVSGRRTRDPVDALLGRLRERTSGARARRAHNEAALAALISLSAELRAGLPPSIALVNASTNVWPTAIAAIRLDGDIPDALRADAADTPVLRALAACWEAGAVSGSGLADSVDQLARSHREAEDVRGQLDVQLAGPRATARMLALLPVFGIVMGLLLGADPLGFLMGSPIGLACLVAGIALTLIGFWWTNRISARVEARL